MTDDEVIAEMRDVAKYEFGAAAQNARVWADALESAAKRRAAQYRQWASRLRAVQGMFIVDRARIQGIADELEGESDG